MEAALVVVLCALRMRMGAALAVALCAPHMETSRE